MFLLTQSRIVLNFDLIELFLIIPKSGFEILSCLWGFCFEVSMAGTGFCFEVSMAGTGLSYRSSRSYVLVLYLKIGHTPLTLPL